MATKKGGKIASKDQGGNRLLNYRKRRNGTVTAHHREWPLYERFKDGLMGLFMSPEDQAELYALDEAAIKRAA